MTLTVLSVAYPLAPVGPDAVGGAEQVLSQIEAALVGAGGRSIVIACEGSQTVGELIAVPRATGVLDEAAMGGARQRHREAIAGVMARTAIDVVHVHGIDFHAYLPPPGPPVLATLHLPVAWYPRRALLPERPATYLQCVSDSQHADLLGNPYLLPPIGNGVAVPKSPAPHVRRGFALLLSRICPEKGIHVAIEAAKLAGVPLLIGGDVFPYADHRRYFEEEVRPRLNSLRRFLGPVGRRRKSRLLAAAACVLIPSLIPETSSLVAREALAAGTPVVAFRQGALPETVEHGRTGFIVDDIEAMAAAIRLARGINSNACRDAARERFSLEVMTAAYLGLYRRLAREDRPSLAGAA